MWPVADWRVAYGARDCAWNFTPTCNPTLPAVFLCLPPLSCTPWLVTVFYSLRCVFLPDNGAFFINYVITAALLGTGMELMRLGSLFVYSTRLFFSRSEPERLHIRKVRARLSLSAGFVDSGGGREAALRSELQLREEPQKPPSQGSQETASDSYLPLQKQAIEFQYGREYAWMMNVFTVVMAYSITCPIIVPFGESSLRHT